MARSVDVSSDTEETRSLALSHYEPYLLQSSSKIDDFRHILKIHVSELFSVVAIEQLILLIHIIQFPHIVHDLLVSHSNSDELIFAWFRMNFVPLL